MARRLDGTRRTSRALAPQAAAARHRSRSAARRGHARGIAQAAGYLTFHVGKWHLGDGAHAPETQGFDLNIGGTHWGAPNTFFWPFNGSNTFRDFRYVPGLGVGRPGDYLTDRLTDEAIKLVDAAGGRPFFLNLWFHNPHTPIEGKPDLVERYRAKLKPGMNHQNPEYAAMIHTLDENVGRLLAHLDRRGLSRRTLVVFTSDNGGYVGEFKGARVTDNTPLRSGKGSLYEGGIRVPLIARLPGLTPAGAVCDAPVQCMDYFPTLAELAGAGAESASDGRSIATLLRNPPRGFPTRRAVLPLSPLLRHDVTRQRHARRRLETAGVPRGPTHRTLQPDVRPRGRPERGRRISA
ncbi:MAG: sulfatase-like hydrolase/transferase [Verrucomicrobiae bacterium]|nr:sulfatase-like hydrolase/transferase [Verrucomicrobiae bacterium]